MSRSKLEICVDILKALAQRPLKLPHIMCKANINCSTLSEYIEFLLKQGLIEKRTLKKNKIVYAITQHGLITLKSFREIQQELPIRKEK